MKVKMKHNKKRNTAFLYEVLVRQITKCVLEEDNKERKYLLSLMKKYFSKGTPLSEELSLYRSVLECEKHNQIFIERVISESKTRYASLSRDRIFSEQSQLISVLNKKYGKDVYNSQVPNYRNLATLSAIFNNSTPVKTKVLLERNLVNDLASVEDEPPQHELMGSSVLLKEVMKGYNEKYSNLYEEQKCLLNAFILSLSDDGLSLKAFLNEELSRLKKIINESLKLQEIQADPQMKNNTQQVVKLFESFKTKPVDQTMLEQILKIQTLAREVQS